MTTASHPEVDYTKEVRFAVVMYGGVSLAIYINGVAQELLRLVRATAKDGTGDKALLANEELSGSERVYRKLSHLLADDHNEKTSVDLNDDIPTRFVVDTITGASAGGINGIFLAKALVRGESLDPIQQLWIREGAIEKLLNDRLSKDPPVGYDNPPPALLNAKRMYLELLKAFEDMDKPKTEGSSATKTAEGSKSSRPLVDELDLFVTTTDLHGVVLPMRLTDEVIYERRHKNVFHLVYPREGYWRDGKEQPPDVDFIRENNPFLAYAARCTSSFPFAFEPMVMQDVDPVVKYYGLNGSKPWSEGDIWKRFFHDYEKASGIEQVPPERRAFADGGDLDNKPFGFAIDTLSRRHADYPISRKLLYVEPAPEHPEDVIDKGERPDFIENALDALSTLPRAETIREDLQRLNDRNRLVVRVNRVLENVDIDMDKAMMGDGSAEDRNVLATIKSNQETLRSMSDDDWSTLYLDDMIKRKGRAYAAYHRLEIASVTDDLARIFIRGGGLSDDSDFFAVYRSFMRAWRGLRYTDHRYDKTTESGVGVSSSLRPINEFLTHFNLAYPLRRISFLRNRIEILHCLDGEKLTKTYSWAKEFGLTPARVDEFRQELRRIYRKLRIVEKDLRSAQRELLSRPKQSSGRIDAGAERHQVIALLGEEIVKKIQGGVSSDGTIDPTVVLDRFLVGTKKALCDSPESESDHRAELFLRAFPSIWSKICIIADDIGAVVRVARAQADRECRTILKMNSHEAGNATDAAAQARKCLQNYYQNYDEYDMIIFPIMYETEVGEPAQVDVFRVSPEDATALIDERATRCRKLAGTALGHFGAFLEKRWRENDILWGRLDGAERIISSLLPATHPLKAELVAEAQAAIVYETISEMGVCESRNLLCESLMRTASGKAEPSLLTNGDLQNPGFLDKLTAAIGALDIHPHEAARAKLGEKVDKIRLRDHYCEVFPKNSRPQPEDTLKTAARATTIVGKMFERLADDQMNAGKKYAAWITRVGVVTWGFAELATPHSLWNLVFRHWLKLLYAFEVVMIVGATILAKPEVSQFGWTLFGITAGLNAVVWLLHDYMIYRRRVASFLMTLLVLVIGGLTLIGGIKTASVLFGWTVKGVTPLGWAHRQTDAFSSWMANHLPDRVWTSIRDLAPILLALIFIVVLWARARVSGSDSKTNHSAPRARPQDVC